jgi:hypothetical protein
MWGPTDRIVASCSQGQSKLLLQVLCGGTSKGPLSWLKVPATCSTSSGGTMSRSYATVAVRSSALTFRKWASNTQRWPPSTIQDTPSGILAHS